MSITFSIYKRILDETSSEPKFRYQEIYPAGFDPTPRIDPEMPEYGEIAPENPYDLNMANVNAVDVLKSLGLFEDGEYCGTIIDMADLIQRCDAFITVAALDETFDAAFDAYVHEKAGWATIVECGRNAGYRTDKAIILKAMAQIALANDAVISYC
jgi:hypothetical protein